MVTLSPGDPAPPFELLDQDGSPVRLDDYGGEKLLVYFSPEADTPGCTTQSCDIRDHRQDLARLGIHVVGIWAARQGYVPLRRSLPPCGSC